jgi:phosphoribosylformylglycinamidine synthase
MIAAGHAGVPLTSVGRFTGDTVRLGKSEAPLAELSALFRGTFGATFG